MTTLRSTALPISKQHINIFKDGMDRLNRDIKEHQEIVNRHEQKHLQLQEKQKNLNRQVTPLVARTYNVLQSLQQQLKDKISECEKKISDSSIALKKAEALAQEKQDKIKDLPASQGDTKATPSPKKRGNIKKLNRLTRQMSTHGLTLQTSPDEIKQLTDKSATYQSKIEQLQSNYGEFKGTVKLLQNVDENDLEKCFADLAMEEKADGTNHDLMDQLADESNTIREHTQILQELQEQKALSDNPIFLKLVNTPQELLKELIEACKANIKLYKKPVKSSKIEDRTPYSLLDHQIKDDIAAVEIVMDMLSPQQQIKDAVAEAKSESKSDSHKTELIDLQEKCFQFYGFISHIAENTRCAKLAGSLRHVLNHAQLNDNECNSAKMIFFKNTGGQQPRTTYIFNTNEHRYDTELENFRAALKPFESRFLELTPATNLITNTNALISMQPENTANAISDHNYLSLVNIFELLTDLLNDKSGESKITSDQRKEIETQINKNLRQQVSKLKMGLGLFGIIVGSIITIAGILALPVTLGISVLPLAAYNSIAVGSVTSAIGVGFFLKRNNYTDISKKALGAKKALAKIEFLNPPRLQPIPSGDMFEQRLTPPPSQSPSKATS